MKLAMAVGMDEPQVCGIVRAAPLLEHYMMDVERLAIFESLVTAGVQPLLAPGESPVAMRRRSESTVPGRFSPWIGHIDRRWWDCSAAECLFVWDYTPSGRGEPGGGLVG